MNPDLRARTVVGAVLVAVLLAALLDARLAAALWVVTTIGAAFEAVRLALRASLGWFYLPVVLLGGASLVALSFRPRLLLALYLGVWGADSFAYLVGSRWGRTRLAPRISPAKTWEGFAAGLLGAAAVAALVGAPLVGLAAGLVGPAGDLAESAVKRAAGVKDAGTILGPHGGILDRFDAMFVVAPIVWCWA